ncbi:hypothetical protein BCR24_09090 [Enterococcus ureilyticus]|uniref:Uncharacterized protein n=1 Tax=Enterococcus ureilyticus TaxID=1131292 RepID=A0A1E5H8J1_9ENTE|nr:hypothetical protein BCR24_09090 [Enterococcus ureilyticus]
MKAFLFFYNSLCVEQVVSLSKLQLVTLTIFLQLQKDSEGNQSEPANFKLPADPADGTGNGGNLGNNGSTGLQNLNATQKKSS